MARHTFSSTQRLTVRQVVITISIVALAYFAFKYGRNVLRYRELQAELAKIEAHIAAVDAQQEVIERTFDESISPQVVDDFAKGDMNWVKNSDEIIITVGGQGKSEPVPVVSEGETSAAAPQPEKQPANWQLWLKMLAGD